MKRKMNVSGRNLNATNQITHIVLNTGQMCEIRQGEFTSEAMRMFRQLVKSGGGLIPLLEGTDVVIEREQGCALFVFHDRNDLPLLAILLGFAEPGAADTWDFFKQQYFETSACDDSRLVFGDCDYPKMPSSLPWLASQIFQPGYSLEVHCPDFMRILACIGQGLAAAIIELDTGCQWN